MILKDWIKKSKITPYRVAKMLGCSTAYIYNHLSGRQRISAKYAVKIETMTKGDVSRTEAVWPEDFIDKKGKMKQMTFLNKIEGECK